ncbi:hypothetical protein METP1_01956 [Methanosarcinales archaeon]|nr:hypothetical protein METP1_01956 [Methanosarcinales archaeon]
MVKESLILGMSRSRNFRDKKKVAQFLGTSFSNLKDRKVGWEVLRMLANDSNQFVKSSAIEAIHSSYVYIPNKEDAWQYLLYAVQDPKKNIRIAAAVAISKVFDILPNKEKGWMDLLETITKSAKIGNHYPAFTMHDCFDCLEDKEKYIDSLKQLTDIDDFVIRSSSNNLIGRIYISKSVKENGDEFKKTYLEGLTYLKKSVDEFDTPRHKFCYIVHNIFNKIIEGELKDVSELNKGIEELKTISKESTERQKIVKILDELYNVLDETLDAQKKGEDISKFKDKIIPICTKLNILISTLNNEIIRQIAQKAKERINFAIKALKIVDHFIESPDKLTSESNLLVELVELLKLCCVSISEPICSSYKSKLEEIEKESVADKKQAKLLQLIKEMRPVLKHETTSHQYQNNIPRIQTVHICDTKQDVVRVAVIQFCYKLSKSFPFIIENKEEVKRKIFSGLDIAEKERTNIVCLPELCLREEWIIEIEKKYPNIIVIGGGFYKNDRNICPVITKSDKEISPQLKITPAASEDMEMWDKGMISGDRIYKYETQFGKFVILICRDFERFAHYFIEIDIDFIFCPAFNEANERFHIEADSHVTKTPSYILIANTGINGGSSIFAQMNKNHFDRLIGEGFKDVEDPSFKLCEAKKGKDEIIIADFNLKNKSIQIPTPSESSKEKRSVTYIKKLPIP